jgi:hypothetical protein
MSRVYPSSCLRTRLVDNSAAQQLIEPERNQLAFHPQGLKAGFVVSRAVKSGVMRLHPSKNTHVI